MSALLEEQEGLVQQLQHPKKIRRAGRDFWHGELQGHRVVMALSRIGKVAAATTATTLIEAFGATRVVFTGVAGGLGDGVRVGDVVIARHFLQHDMDATPLFPKYEIPLYGQTLFPCDANSIAIFLKASDSILTRGSDHLFAQNEGRTPVVHCGLIATADRFVASAQEATSLKAALQSEGFEALAVEMEGAAVAQVCFDYAVPFAAVRTISDRADDTAHVDFPKFVAKVASHYSREIIGEFLKMLPK